MNSHHDHHHGHDHDHHGHHHHEESVQGLSFEEKLVKMFEHWVKHNESHARTYLDWHDKAKARGLDEIATLLDDITRLSDQLTDKLKNGLKEAKKS